MNKNGHEIDQTNRLRRGKGPLTPWFNVWYPDGTHDGGILIGVTQDELNVLGVPGLELRITPKHNLRFRDSGLKDDPRLTKVVGLITPFREKDLKNKRQTEEPEVLAIDHI